MRRTNKRHNIKKRKTLKKRFSKRGGLRICCEFCNQCFEEKTVYGISYDTHIQTHPKCAYCGEQVINNTELIKHIFKNHKEQYNIAKDMKDTIKFNSPSIIDDLASGQITLTKFYERIQNKIDKNAKKTKEANEKAIKAEEKVRLEEAKKLARETARLKEEAKRLARETAKKEAELAERAKLEAEKERQTVIKAEREAQKKAEEDAKKLEKEILAEEERKKKKALKRAAKDAAIAEKELTAMGAEDINVPEVNQQLIEELNTANTVEDAIEIIESAAEPTVFKVPTVPIQNINLIKMLSDKEIITIQNPNFQGNITYGMTSLFPAIKCFSEEINKLTNKKIKFNEYKMINNLILFLVGLFNNKFIENNIGIRMIIKGGKGAQIILSAYDFYNLSNGGKVNCDIISDDIDILLVQENGYNRETLYSVAKQFSNLVKRFVDEKGTENPLISIREPIPDAFNPNIFKISYINKTNPNKIKYNVVSDIDFKQVESEFFDINNIEGFGFPNEYNPYGLQYNYNNYIFNLRYWLQSPQAFLDEKQYYLSIYENIIQKSSTIKDKICDCNNIIEEGKQGFDYDCYMACKVREMMIPKFQKYITPFQQLVNILNNQNNFAGHYSL